MRVGRTRTALATFVCLATVLQGSAGNARAQDARSSGDLAKQLGVNSVSKGTSSWLEKRKSLAVLPLNGLNPQQRSRADVVVKSLSQFRRLPTIQTAIEPEVYTYFLAQPDVAVSLWRVMGISEFQLNQTSRVQFSADAGDGSRGTAEMLYRDNRQCLVLVNGFYKNPVLTKPISARALVHLQFQFTQTRAGQPPMLTQSIAAFISFPSTAVKTVAKVISPVTNRIMDRNAVEIAAFMKVMSDSMQTRPQWVQGMSKRMQGVAPIRRTELSNMAAQVNTKAKARNLQAYLKRSQGKVDPRTQVMQITNPSGGVVRRASQTRLYQPRR